MPRTSWQLCGNVSKCPPASTPDTPWQRPSVHPGGPNNGMGGQTSWPKQHGLYDKNGIRFTARDVAGGEASLWKRLAIQWALTRNRWKLEIIDEELRRGSGCNRVGRIARKIEETGCQERIAGVVRKESERPSSQMHHHRSCRPYHSMILWRNFQKSRF